MIRQQTNSQAVKSWTVNSWTREFIDSMICRLVDSQTVNYFVEWLSNSNFTLNTSTTEYSMNYPVRELSSSPPDPYAILTASWFVYVRPVTFRKRF